MEFSKKEIHTSVLTQSKYSQITVDDDFTIPDSKGDMEKIVAKEGHILLESMIPEDGKVRITGSVCVRVLYRTGGDIPRLCQFQSEIPFEDVVNCDGVSSSSQVDCHSQLEDLTVSMINSRKLEVRGLIGTRVNVYEEMCVDAAMGLEQGEGVDCQYRDITYSQVVLAKRDVLKVREELEIPQNKPNIQEILWQCVALRNMETKAGDEKLLVRGEIEIFILYKSSEERLPVQSIFSVRSLYREIPCTGAAEDMVLSVDYVLGKGEITIRPNGDGEDRIFGCDYNIDMNIKLYTDCDCRMLSDVYSPNAELVPQYELIDYENLLLKNAAKAKVSARKQIGGDKAKLLQICHVYGDVDIDDVAVGENGAEITGVVKCCVLYIATGDDPMSSVEVEIPFSYTADTVPLAQEDSVRISPCIDQLNAALLNSEEIEIKAQVNLNISVFAKGESSVITDMQILPIDEAKKAAQPGIVGYVVRKGDSIWSIAKEYYASIDSIRQLNNLDSDAISEGDRLLIVKS